MVIIDGCNIEQAALSRKEPCDGCIKVIGSTPISTSIDEALPHLDDTVHN